ncbi:hypothetical protein [Myxococcus virescens]|uniref:Uncharacterized protein n=1 Tax=Myxococcus virescens TaxID=83456 RepID=A0A511H827_9BACT|nr:hypothetical protein [Myxococcus virescens]GEL69574.1 hypothetical protein MVI01_13580 [Myxococcus virescens]SDD26300.1 hypothetical protein SAMN04488504_101173 [Myxococcus virescens]
MATGELLAVKLWNDWGRAIAASRGLTALDLSALVPLIRAKKAVTRVLVSLTSSSRGGLRAELQVRFEKKTPVELEFTGTTYVASKELVVAEGAGTQQGGRVELASNTLKLTLWANGVARIIPSVLGKSPFMGRADRYLRCGRIDRLAYGHDVELGLLREIDGDFTADGDAFKLLTRLGLTCTDEADSTSTLLTHEEWMIRMDEDYARMVHRPKVVWRDDDGGRIEPNSNLLNVKWGYRGPKLRALW